MSAAIVIHFEYDGDNLEQVTVSGHRGGKALDEDDLQWLAFRALPHLERTAWTTEESRTNYHMQLAFGEIVRRVRPDGLPVDTMRKLAERLER